MNNTIVKTSNDFEVISFEKCIVCDIVTDIPRNKHIDLREYYIEGAGQLCEQCFNNIDQKKYIKI